MYFRTFARLGFCDSFVVSLVLSLKFLFANVAGFELVQLLSLELLDDLELDLLDDLRDFLFCLCLTSVFSPCGLVLTWILKGVGE